MNIIAIEVNSPILENEVIGLISDVYPSVLPRIVFFRTYYTSATLKNITDLKISHFYSVEELPQEVTHILAFPRLDDFEFVIEKWVMKNSFERGENYIINSKLVPSQELEILSRRKFFKYFSLYIKEETVMVDIRNTHIFHAKNAKQLSLVQKLAHFSRRDQCFKVSSEFLKNLKSQRTEDPANQQGLLRSIKKGKDFWIGTIFPTASTLALNRGYLNVYSRQFVRLKRLNIYSFLFTLFILPKNKRKLTWSYIYQLGQTFLRPSQKAQILNYLRGNKRLKSDLFTSKSLSAFHQITKQRSESTNCSSDSADLPIDEDFLTSFSNCFKKTGTPTVVVFCLDDYSTNIGGVQFYLELESWKVEEMGGNHIAVYPAKYSSRLRENSAIEVMVNRQRVGRLSSQYIANLFDLIQESQYRSEDEMIIGFHALLGHDVKSIVGALKTREKYSGYFYIHDYFSVCPSVKLMRNDWVFCGAPPSTSTSCKVCVYGQERQSHQQEISKLLDLEKIKVIAPSSVADEIWSQANISNKECEVFPHAEIIENFGLEVDQVPNKRPKIAYIGYANRAKGWDSYLEYFQSNKDSEIDFYVFSRDNPRIEGITFVELLNTGRNPSECTNLLNQNGINYVFIWPEWPETFSYVTLEAIAAGCQVVTNKHSGNVRKLAEKYNVSLIPANLQECQSIILNHWSRNRQGQNFQNQYQVIHRNYLLEHLPNKLENSN